MCLLRSVGAAQALPEIALLQAVFREQALVGWTEDGVDGRMKQRGGGDGDGR